VGDQFQTVDQGNAAATAGLKPEQVKIHTLLAGGSFGRRANMGSDYIVEAVSVAKALGANGIPVKLQWTRKMTFAAGSIARFTSIAGSGAGQQRPTGRLAASHCRPIDHRRHCIRCRHGQDGIDGTSVEGAANLPYAVTQHVGRVEHDRDRRAGIMVARRRQFPHRLRDRSLHR
jgi:Aerobic-type carbon monoxide dehydrogenase, large subunit CoxL/CutL homologs